MAAIHETAYPRIKPNLNQKELGELFAPSPEELLLLDANTKRTLTVPRLGFMLILKCYQYLGRPMHIQQIDGYIKNFIAAKLGLPSDTDLSGYDASAKKRHIKIIRDYLQLNTDKKARHHLMKSTALKAATTKENLADIINCVIDVLIKERHELPAFQYLVRLSRAARKVVNDRHYDQICNALSSSQKAAIDDMLVSDIISNNEDSLTWLTLKTEAKKPTRNKIHDYVNYVEKLKALRESIPINLDFIAPARIEQLRDEALIADIDDMKAMRPKKRYALATILIYMKTAASIDDLAQVFIVWVKGISAKAQSSLEAYRLSQAEKTDNFVFLLYNTLLALKNNHTSDEKVRSIENALDGKADELLEECQAYLGLTGENHIKWILRPYKNKRSVIYKILDNLRIESSSNDKAIEEALAFIMQYRSSHREWIEIDDATTIQPNLSLLSDGWFKAVTGMKREKSAKIKKINRHYYEIAVCTVLMGDLSCGDAFVEGGFIFDDPNKQFVTWQEFDSEIEAFCELVTLPKSPEEYITSIQTKLRKTATKVDNNYHNNPYLIIDKGSPILKKIPKKEDHPKFKNIKQMIMDKMPLITIVDAIIEVENWLGLSSHFKPLSGYDPKILDYPSRFVATSLSYGCNLGPTQTERSLSRYTRKQIAWLFNHHVTDGRILKAIMKIINHYHVFELPKRWGTGESVSVDGTFWDMYKQNLLAAHHIRYGRYGGVGYYHVSDKYIALFSNFISCGAHESVYLLDGLIENDSDIQPYKVHGDSWAQSEVLFGLSALLAILIMPRIKNFKHLHYYKVSKEDTYLNINELFTEKTIDWALIKTHYHDMLRVALSIHKGKVKASTVLRKLCSKSRKNKLYFAFRELGRVQRTLFLLNYINESEMRQMIQAATCKSESFNEFLGWIRFGGGGVIADNLKPNQSKIIRFNHLLANMLIFHTVVYQTKGINTLRSQGVDIPDDILAGISPYWSEHLNRFGKFELNIEQPASEIEYSLIS